MKRFSLESNMHGPFSIVVTMEEHHYGDWVEYEDVQDLETTLANHEKVIEDLQEEVDELRELYQAAMNEIDQLESTMGM